MRFAPVALLVLSNIFMTYAWYCHLKDMRTMPLAAVVMISWGVAFFEYCLQVPAPIEWASPISPCPSSR